MNKTLYKVLSWRAVSISTTLCFMYVLTGDVKSATKETLMLHSILIIVHWFFEKLWNSKVS